MTRNAMANMPNIAITRMEKSGLWNIVKNKISYSIRQALDQPLNYARTYLADILPSCLGRIIYLDSDLVVVDDIAKLMHPCLMARGLKKTRTVGSDGTTCYNRWQ